MLLSSSPIRQNGYAFLGSHVLDGSTSLHDWIGIAEISRMPYLLNPESGFIIASNQRVVGNNAKFDIGASPISITRSERIHQLLSEKIKKSNITESDMI